MLKILPEGQGQNLGVTVLQVQIEQAGAQPAAGSETEANDAENLRRTFV
jgi:hypothetical protein